MLKRILLSAFALAIMLPAFAQHKRRVLVEEFSNATSPPCFTQNLTFNAVIASNIDYLTPVRYQTDWPFADPMNAQNPNDVDARVNYYNIISVPNCRQLGTLEVFPLTNYTPGIIEAGYNNLTPVTMTLTHKISPNRDSIYLHVSVTSDAALTGNLRLRVAVTEEEILFPVPPTSHSGEKEFFQVMRKMLPDAHGTATGDFAAAETKSYDFAWKIGYAYDLNKLSAAAWLQNDDTREVYQSAHSLPLGGIPYLGISIPPMNKFNCIAGASPQFDLTNTAPANLTTALLKYRIDGGAWANYTVDGFNPP